MTDEELAEYEEWAGGIWGRVNPCDVPRIKPIVERLIAEVRRLKEQNENLAGELRDEKAYAKELRDNLGQAGIY